MDTGKKSRGNKAKADKGAADKRSDVVKTGVFRKLVRIPVDAEETNRRKIHSADIDQEIDDLLEKQKPTKEKVTQLRAEKRKLKMDIKTGTSEEEADVYEMKDFKRNKADTFLAAGDKKIGTRTLEKADYNSDLEDRTVDTAEA